MILLLSYIIGYTTTMGIMPDWQLHHAMPATFWLVEDTEEWRHQQRWHCFNVIQAAVQFVNPEQIPIISVDQLLFAKMKQLQWSMDRLYGEDKFVLLLRGRHTEMASYRVLGHWLEGSGWVESLHEAETAKTGITESFLKASHITRTRHGPSGLCIVYFTEKCIWCTCHLQPRNVSIWELWRLVQRKKN